MSCKKLEWGEKTLVMGIINCTPDSFYEESRYKNTRGALETAFKMVCYGVDILDIGGESSRPGAKTVSLEQELERIIPVIEGIRKESDVLISVDTYKTEAAKAALDAGADIINDIYALRDNPSMADLIAERNVPVIMMHMKGDPSNMQIEPFYEDTIAEIKNELTSSIDFALSRGIRKEQIIIDPGIGFGKRIIDNLLIIKNLKEFKNLGFPLLMGLSRKSFIGKLLNNDSGKRLAGTITANTMAVLNGADIVRVHDYHEAVDMVKIINAITKA